MLQEATAATKQDVGVYYGLRKALEEYGWDEHYSERAQLIRKVDEWLREKKRRGEL